MLAAGPGGRFAALWVEPSLVAGERDELILQTFAFDGGAAELLRPVPQLLLDRLAAGAEPLLADVDGDGRDDLCVAFADRFQCDVVGVGLREISIPGGVDFDTVPLVGNLDGL